MRNTGREQSCKTGTLGRVEEVRTVTDIPLQTASRRHHPSSRARLLEGRRYVSPPIPSQPSSSQRHHANTPTGATLDEPFQESNPIKINGSVMIAHDATKEEVLAEIRKDIYATTGVWDLEKIQIYPFKAAFYKS
jgi:hypothetical protein